MNTPLFPETEFHERLVNARIVSCCLSCINYQKETEGCELAEGNRPPANIIVYGCARWKDIPF